MRVQSVLRARRGKTKERIDFGENCLEIPEDLNVNMYSQYTMQIGVNTGGGHRRSGMLNV
jgi:hypothetical protein